MTSLKQFFLSLAMVAGFFTLTVFTSGCETTTPPAGDCTTNDIRRTYSGTDKKTIGVGICRTAIETCESNMWVNQQTEVLPGVETCNGSDDDCDGRVDNVPNITCTKNLFATPAILTTATSATTSTADTILLAGTVTDPEEGVASVVLDNLVLTPRQEVLADLPSQSGGVFNWSGAVSLKSGANVVKVTATNNEGQETIKEILVTYNPADTTPPMAIVSVSSPATATSSTFTFTVTGTDSGGAVASANCQNISANGSTVSVTGVTPTWLASATLVETTVFSCTVVDGAGNRSAPVPVTVRYTPVVPKDTTPPVVNINAPSAVSLTPIITLTGDYSEAGEMDKVVVTNLTAAPTTKTLAAFTGNLWVASGVPLVPVGQNVLSVVGNDKDGNASAVQYVYVNYQPVVPDTEKPVIAVALVSPAVATSSAFSFVGTASDNVAVSAVSCFNASANGSTVSVVGTTAWAATMSLVQGTTVLICSSVDSNNLRSETKTIVIAYNVPASTDTTAPTVDVTSPSASSTSVVASVTLMGSASDSESAVVEVTATNLATGTTTICPTTGPTARTRAFTCPVVLEENINTVTVASKDAAGNVGTKNINVVYEIPNVDTTPPVLTIATASPALATTSAFTFSGVALDLVGVTSVTCRNISGNASTVTVTGTATWTASATLAVGSTTFACQARDARNDSVPDIIVVSYTPVTPVDTGSPTVTITAAATSTVDTITVSGSATDNVAVTAVTVTNLSAGSNGAPATLNTVAGSVTWTIPVTLVLGSNRISAVSRDAVGNVSTVQYVVVVYTIPLDTTKPTAVLTTTSPATATSSVFSFTGTAADNVGVTSVTCVVLASNGSTCATPVGTTSWAVGATLADGVTVFAVQSKDLAGNTSDPVIMQVSFNLPVNPADTTAPTVTITAPTATTVTSNLLTLTGGAGDNVGVSKVTVANITTGVGRLATLGGSATSATWMVPVTLVSGPNLISAVSEDSSGRVSNPAYVTVTYTPPVTTADTTKPTVVVTTATPATTTSSSFSFAGTAADNVGVTSVTCSVVSGPVGSACATPVGTTSWVVGATLTAGTTVFAIVSHDALGNSSDPGTIQVTYTPPAGTTADTTAPTVAVATPNTSTIVANVITLTGVAGDNVGVSAVLVSNTTTAVLNTPATLIGTGGSITWTAAVTLASGNNTILVVSRDAAGNSSLAVTVVVNNTGTGGSSGGGSTGGIIPNGSGIIPTGKYEVVCVAGSSADCKVTVWNESTDYPLATSARVSATPRQFCFGSLIDTPSGDRVQLSSSSGSDKVRVYYPNGEPVLDPATGSPVLKLSQAFGFTSRARLGLSDLRCSDFY
jgi:hypothetical protein